MSGTITTSSTRAATPADVLVFPGDSRWESLRGSWRLTGARRPAAVALPRTGDEVVAVVEYAASLGLTIVVRGTDRADIRLDGALLLDLEALSAAAGTG